MAEESSIGILHLSDWEQKYESLFGRPDPRTNHWIFVRSHYLPFVTMVIYIIICAFSKKIMNHLPTFELKGPMLLYNIAMVIVNAHIVYEIAVCSYQLRYNWLCEPCNYGTSDLELRIAKACWWYFVSKYIELLDTAFFILRKKFVQVTFLHVFHHSTMLLNWWLGAKYYAGGQFVFVPLINSSVHVVMYSYYGLSALGPAVRPYLWWKKYLTKVQLTQFVLIGIQNCIPIFGFCDTKKPLFLIKVVVYYQVILIFLFGNFYIKNYLKKRNTKAD